MWFPTKNPPSSNIDPKTKHHFYIVPWAIKMDLPGNDPLSKPAMANSHPHLLQVTLTFIDQFGIDRNITPRDNPTYRPLKYDLPIARFPTVWPIGPPSALLGPYKLWCEGARSGEWIFNESRRWTREDEMSPLDMDILVLVPHPTQFRLDIAHASWKAPARDRTTSLLQDIVDILDANDKIKIVGLNWLLDCMDKGKLCRLEGYEITAKTLRDLIKTVKYDTSVIVKSTPVHEHAHCPSKKVKPISTSSPAGQHTEFGQNIASSSRADLLPVHNVSGLPPLTPYNPKSSSDHVAGHANVDPPISPKSEDEVNAFLESMNTVDSDTPVGHAPVPPMFHVGSAATVSAMASNQAPPSPRFTFGTAISPLAKPFSPPVPSQSLIVDLDS